MARPEMKTRRPSHARHLTRPSRSGCNGFARARSLSSSEPSAKAEFLSPFPKRLKSRVSWTGSLGGWALVTRCSPVIEGIE